MLDVLKNKKFIFFDIGYTLDKPTNGDWLFTTKFMQITKGKLDGFTIEQLNHAKVAGLRYSAAHHLTFTVEQEIEGFRHFYQNVSDDLGINLTKDEIEQIAVDRACNMENYTPMPNLKEIFETLKDRFEFGIISDTWPSVVNQLYYLGVYDYFKCYTFSCHLGIFKPDKKMYVDALNKCGYDPQDCVFIDDNIHNLDAAKQMGITPILIAVNPTSYIETEYTKIYSLDELIK